MNEFEKLCQWTERLSKIKGFISAEIGYVVTGLDGVPRIRCCFCFGMKHEFFYSMDDAQVYVDRKLAKADGILFRKF